MIRATSKNIPLACLMFLLILSGASSGQTTEPATQPVLTLEQQISDLDSRIDSRVNPPTAEDRGKLAMQRLQLRQRLSQEEAIKNAPQLAAEKAAKDTSAAADKAKVTTDIAGQSKAVILTPATLIRPDAPENVKQFWARTLAGQANSIREAARNHRRDELKRLKSSPLVLSSLDIIRCSVGDVGDGGSGGSTVSQVIDDKNVMVALGGMTFWFSDVNTAGLVDGSVMNLNSLLPTRLHVFVVSGTKHYTTALGASRTVFLLTPLDLKPYFIMPKSTGKD